MIPVHSYSSYFMLFPIRTLWHPSLVCIIWKYTYKSVHDKLTSTWFTYAHTHKFYFSPFFLLLPYDLILLLALTLIQSYSISSPHANIFLLSMYEIVCNTPQASTIFTVRSETLPLTSVEWKCNRKKKSYGNKIVGKLKCMWHP